MISQPPPEYWNSIVTADCREFAKDLPDESVHLILCDPVYQELWQYEWLVGTALRVLVPGGSLVAECGSIHRFAAEHVMHHAAEGTPLIHRPMLNELLTGGFAYVHMHRCHRACNHHLWFEKGGIREGRGCPRTAFWGSKDKSRHKWGDGERAFMQVIDWLSQPGDVVADFFAGGGTVPVCCVELGRQFVACEIDPETADRGRQRLADLTPSLFEPGHVPAKAESPGLFGEGEQG